MTKDEHAPVLWLDEEKKIFYWHNTDETSDYHGLKRTTPLYRRAIGAKLEEKNT